MLAGRAFQGVGSGVILSLVEIVLADVVSLSERCVVIRMLTRFLAKDCLMCSTRIGGASKVLLVPSGHWRLQQVRCAPSSKVSIRGSCLE
jgi:hypothetical protein